MEYKIKELNVSDIKPDKNQPRKTFDSEKLKDMSETFKTQGTIQPIEIDENNVIITGELRYRACKLADLKTIPCKILNLTSEQKLERQLVENFNRQDMRLVDSIEAVKRFVKHLTSLPELKNKFSSHDEMIGEAAKRLGISRVWLSQNLKLDREASPELKKAIKEEKISISTATEIMKAPKEEREELVKEVLEESKIPEHRKIRERVKEKKDIAKLKEDYKKLKDEDDKKLKIQRAIEIVNTYRSVLNNFMEEAKKTVVQLRLWKKQEYNWFDKKSRNDLNRLIYTTRQILNGMLKEVDDLEATIEV